MERKEKADQKQALSWLRENLNPDARPGRKRHKKHLLGTKNNNNKKIKTKPKKPKKTSKTPKSTIQNGSEWGNYTKEEGKQPY